jgi:hypothetical protein
MNGYWDAVVGAALGLPGTARPDQGPRPLADSEDQGLPVEIEDFRDAPLPRAPLSPATRPAPPSAAAATEAPAERAVPAPAPTRPAAAPTREAEPESRRPAAEPPAVPGITPIVPRAPQAPDDAPARLREAPQPVASEPAHAEPARHAPLKAIESPSAVAAPPALPPAFEDRRAETAAPPPAPPAAEPATVTAEPLATLAPPIEKEDEQAAPPTLSIEIGRIDVRVGAPPAPPPPIAAKSKPLPDSVPSLADYLARRSEAGR